MLRKFYPKAYISSLAEVGPEFFVDRGIKGIILDLDNTIIPWKAGVLEAPMADLLIQFREAGIRLCVVSNALNQRVESLLRPLGIPWIARAIKPRRRPFRTALEILGTEPKETAVVGDQIFTDVFGGNRVGLYTVLVVPMSKKEFIGTRIVRQIEKRLLNRISKKGIIKYTGKNKKNF